MEPKKARGTPNREATERDLPGAAAARKRRRTRVGVNPFPEEKGKKKKEPTLKVNYPGRVGFPRAVKEKGGRCRETPGNPGW